MNFNIFASRTARTAGDMCKHVRKLLSAQRDILSPQAVEALETALNDTKKAVADRVPDDALKKQMSALETAANKWLKPYPNAVLRENVEVLLVALAVAMGIRTFFIQPFKIPTGSMQPTLFGVTQDNLRDHPGFVMPNFVSRFFDYWVNGNSYFDIKAPENGELEDTHQPPTKLLLFNLKQEYQFNHKWYTVWFPPDDLFARAGLGGYSSHEFKAGDTMVRLKVTAGDHLFVDRMSYNFRKPKRGEIVVFETSGIPADKRDAYQIPGDQFYIKRLVALGGEQVQIGDDRHLIINGTRLDTNTPHFEKIYSFDPNEAARESHFSGHVNGSYRGEYGPGQAPLFPNSAATYTVDPGHYLVMGDNTMNSLDSRFWGQFPQEAVIGRYFFVYWPISDRFGMNVR